MKTSSLMMCALVALTACGTGVKQSVRPHPVCNAEAYRLLSASGQHGPKSLNGSRRWILQHAFLPFFDLGKEVHDC